MSLVKQLLADIPQQQLKSYESYLTTHLKLLTTSINKAKVQDLTQVLIRKNKCIQSCYKSHLQQPLHEQSMIDKVQQIRACKQRCGQQKIAVKKYLDDINYYSSLKMSRCLKGCGEEGTVQYNQCLWGCYNKLDRRYKKYWVEERQKVENKFVQ